MGDGVGVGGVGVGGIWLKDVMGSVHKLLFTST